MALKVLKDDRDKGFSTIPISSLTVVKGDLLDLDVGATTWTLVANDSVHFTRKAIAQEAATTAATELLVLELDGSEEVEAESHANSSSSDTGDRMIATDANTVNNSGTDVSLETAIFLQTGVLGAAADKRIKGYVLVGSGVNPDAHTS